VFTNPEGLSLTDIWKPVFDQSGISAMAYVPPTLPEKRADWPTLGELIDSNKRVVVFFDAGADTSVVDFILPEFDMLWEPPFSSTDDTFPCRVDRTSGSLSPEEHLHMLNHNLNVDVFGTGILVPDYINAGTTNGMDSYVVTLNLFQCSCRSL
jgi:hypothetical protein